MLAYFLSPSKEIRVIVLFSKYEGGYCCEAVRVGDEINNEEPRFGTTQNGTFKSVNYIFNL